MSELELQKDIEENFDEPLSEVESEIAELKDEVDKNEQAAILCETKENNPNFLSIIHANKNFCQTFNVEWPNILGKSYDFLFSDFDLDYSSEEHAEYIRLIKSVKDFHPCSLVVSLQNDSESSNRTKFKINFVPTDVKNDKTHHAVFTFEEIDSIDEVPDKKEASESTASFLRSMERTLRNERLLREVSNLIISDLPIREIAQTIAELLCRHLKVDRCLIHDYKEGSTNFVVEYYDGEGKAMFRGADDLDSLKVVANYINFQNQFYKKFGSRKKKSSLAVVEDVMSDRNFLAIKPIYEEFAIASQIAVTTAFNGKVNGGIYIHQSHKRTWLADEVELVETVADQFSIAVDRSDSIEKVMVANHALMEKTAQLRESLKQEQEMRKMQTEFVALVSHEFKTPLQIIDSAREVAARKIKSANLGEATDKSLDRIKSAITRMNGLINSVLNLAKMESGENVIKLEIAQFDLKKFVNDIIEKNSNLAQNKNITVLTKIDDLPTEFNGDQKLLDHSLTNVVSNAIKYSRSNSVVKIIAKASDKRLAIRVVDSGIGIPKEDLENIGNKFFRARNSMSVAGTGIGIYLTKHFIELHGGDVLIESEVNVGTSVTIILPRTL